jgi:acetyl esterase/lipase
MRAVPFSLYDYIFGIEIDDLAYTLETDILYLNNGNDSFFFDYYKPVGEGPFPVIIAIHGGGWVMGNKGIGNMAFFNKYFASKGYVVFDIQYGVYDVEALASEMGGFGGVLAMVASLVTPSYNLNYTIPQQLNNIGNFTKVLELNQTKYHADLDKVFIVGRSAGGYLAAMVSLGYQNPFFTGVFASSMNIRGGIWFYPATQVINATFFDVLLQGSLPLEEMYQWYSPFFLIQNSTIVPPIMIVHGTKDRLADYATNGVEFQQYAHSLDKTCILIEIPGAGHAFDLLFQSYGGQISTYYIERFMGLELGG